jgi:hypothetical protein
VRFKIKDDEGLIAINSGWLKTHPLLTAYSKQEWQAKLKSRFAKRNQLSIDRPSLARVASRRTLAGVLTSWLRRR